MHLGDLDAAARWYAEALRRDPVNPDLLDQVIAFEEEHGDADAADELRRRRAELAAIREERLGQA